MDTDKISKLQSQAKQVRVGGKGTPRRKKKVVHKTAMTDEKKLQQTLKKQGLNDIPGIEEVNMIKEDGKVIHFTNPKVQACIPANTFSVNGTSEEKPLSEFLPSILNQLVGNDVNYLMKHYNTDDSSNKKILDDTIEDAIPQLVENFDEASKDD